MAPLDVKFNLAFRSEGVHHFPSPGGSGGYPPDRGDGPTEGGIGGVGGKIKLSAD